MGFEKVENKRDSNEHLKNFNSSESAGTRSKKNSDKVRTVQDLLEREKVYWNYFEYHESWPG